MKDKAYEQKLWEQIEVHIPKLSKREARFRQVDKIPTLGAFMKAYEKDCSDCLLYRKEIERVLVNLPEILKHKPVELETFAGKSRRVSRVLFQLSLWHL